MAVLSREKKASAGLVKPLEILPKMPKHDRKPAALA
jgi:hypothetical protein